MSRTTKIAVTIILVHIGIGIAVVAILIQHGFSARDQPMAVEAFVARRLRVLAIPRSAREMKNPIISLSKDLLAEARAHFADHCAICHANDGSGDTQIGRNLYPKTPDMRKSDTQSLSDGELFYIIHNGIRFTGMPAWGGERVEADQDSWKLVHFIRHLPDIVQDELNEMKKLNPKSRRDLEEEEETRQFLMGEGAESPSGEHHH